MNTTLLNRLMDSLPEALGPSQGTEPFWLDNWILSVPIAVLVLFVVGRYILRSKRRKVHAYDP